MQTLFRSQRRLRIIGAFAVLAVVLLQPGLSYAGAGNAAGEAALSRPGLVPAVVYTAGDGHIHELALKGTWKDTDLSLYAVFFTPSIRPMALRRTDGVPMVVYTDEDFYPGVHAFWLKFVQQGNDWAEVWFRDDLGPVTAFGQPNGYVRSDGLSAIVYIGTDHHVYEGRREDKWYWADLTLLSGAPDAYAGVQTGLAAYVRGDGTNTVVFQD